MNTVTVTISYTLNYSVEDLKEFFFTDEDMTDEKLIQTATEDALAMFDRVDMTADEVKVEIA